MKKLSLVLFAALPLSAFGHDVEINGKIAFDIQKVADGVYAAIVPQPAMPAVSNSAFIVLSDGVLVVDSHMTRDASRALLSEIQRITKKPVRYLVQTHHHGDHVGGNPEFPEAIDIFAHENARENLRKSNQTGARLPSATLNGGLTFHRGREVKIGYAGRGHTDGDLYVWLPKESVLIAGDLVFNGYIGFMRDGYASDWADTLGKLIELKPQTVVPGHGKIADVNAIKIFRTYIWDFIVAVKKYKDEGMSGSQTVANFKMPKSYESWGMQDKALKDNILRVYHQLPERN